MFRPKKIIRKKETFFRIKSMYTHMHKSFIFGPVGILGNLIFILPFKFVCYPTVIVPMSQEARRQGKETNKKSPQQNYIIINIFRQMKTEK